ncbi:glycosyltransferase family 9 protein [bacterium]|jgi:heptosyltransferase I|nr:glycosyltransferase family 9 protein [bacterium]
MKKILIGRGDVLGDVILATSLIMPLREKYPTAKIYFLVKKEYFSLFSSFEYIDGCIEDTLPYTSTLKDAKLFYKLVRTIKELDIDIFIGAWRVEKYAWLSFLSKIPVRIGHGTSFWNKRLYTSVTSFNFLDFFNHQVRWNQSLLDLLSIRPKKVELSLHIKTERRPSFQSVCTFLEEPFICIHLEAGLLQKTAMTSTLTLFVQHLISLNTKSIVLIGRERVKHVATELMKLSTDNSVIYDCVEKLSFTETLTVVSKCTWFFGPDSGLAHVAACYRKPSSVYFLNRTQSPLEWAPWTTNVNLIMAKHSCTDICRPTSCQKTDCRQGILEKDLKDTAVSISNHLKNPEDLLPCPNIKESWLKAGCSIGIISKNKAFVSECIDHGFTCFNIDPTLSISKMKKIIVDKNINVIVHGLEVNPRKLQLVSIWASNYIHFKPVIVHASNYIDFLIILKNKVIIVPTTS